MDRCWILLGMMGAGKSAVGRALAELSGRSFQDTDLILQQKLGRPIPQIFAVYGEAAFRDHETSVLRSLEPSSCVLATGGGIVLRDENWTEMRRLGTTVHLRVDRATLTDRLEKSKKRRPLLETEDWERKLAELLEARKDLYARADLEVDVADLDVRTAARRVLERLMEHESTSERSAPQEAK